ncbi:MAG: nucleotidyltransferase domain-containing protein [Deltaproteobacteria bacterium]|nr:nucleotidyltransferase domain-containing protein [Deltaproteobacteria bacterium]
MTKNEILNTLEKYKEKNKNKYQIQRIGIFGSAAKGQMNKKSDIDIVVKLAKQDLFNLVGIKQELEEALYYPIDIVSYRTNMNQFLKGRIDKEAIYV